MDKTVLQSILFLFFMPLPKLPILHLAPINFVYLIGLYYLILRRDYLGTLRPLYIGIPGMILIFALLNLLALYTKGKSFHEYGAYMRMFVFTIIIVAMCNNENNLYYILKRYLFFAFLTTFFGFLIYFVGGPFIAMKKFMTSSSTGGVEIEVGMMLAGLYAIPHQFGYLMAVMPILCLGLHYYSNKKIWFYGMIFFLLALVLNAERSALLANVVGVIFLMVKIKRYRIIAYIPIFVILAIILSFVVQKSGVLEKDLHQGGPEKAGTLKDRLADVHLSFVTNRILYQGHGLVSIIKSPLFGPTEIEYKKEVYGLNKHQSHTRYGEAAFPHNHYVNIGMWAGVPGWFLFIIFIILVLKMHSCTLRQLENGSGMLLLYRTLSAAFVSVLINALFHNAGIFKSEFASYSQLAFFMAAHKVATNKEYLKND